MDLHLGLCLLLLHCYSSACYREKPCKNTAVFGVSLKHQAVFDLGKQLTVMISTGGF